jgi:bifunctional non-homologous end joining protein LigD
MRLQRPRLKSEPGRTPHPRPGALARASVPAPRFTIFKRDSTPIQCELRLEIDGVLKRWALPRDPVALPEGKRIAMQEDDVPLEGVESDGAPWDAGTWVPVGTALASYRRGNLRFELKGRKLKGCWALVRTGNASTGKKDLWLLVKRDDGA